MRTCTGTETAGIVVDNNNGPDAGIHTLQVNTLTGNIAPAADTPGISFIGTNPTTTIITATGANSIITTGTASGISLNATTAAVIDQSGNITANGSGSGITVTAATDIDITIQSGSAITGGTGGLAAGVSMNGGGATNTLTNSGTISAESDWAVRATTGNDAITNNVGGILIGSIDLGAGNNSVSNAGELRSGDNLNVGAGNTVTSTGTLRPGGNNIPQLTTLTGSLIQSGTYAVDINTATGASDRIDVSENTTISGTITPTLVNRALTDKTLTIISTGGTLTSTATVGDTAAYDYSLQTVGTELRLNIRLANMSALVSAIPLTPNQNATVSYIDRILPLLAADQTNPMVLFLDTVGGLPTNPEIVAALDRLNPQTYIAGVANTLASGQALMSSLMSCPAATEEGVVHSETQCYWAALTGRTAEWDQTSTNIGGSENAGGITGGVQGFVAPDMVLGGALSYERSSTDTDNAADSDGDRLSAGLVLKGLYGDTTVAGAVFGGMGWFDTTRHVMPGVTAEGDQDIGFTGAGVRLSHVFDQGGWYAKPIIDAGATYLSYGDIAESGAGVANLIVDGEDEWVLNLAAALEIGSTMVIQQGLIARPYMRLGIIALSESDFSLTSQFVGAPAGAGDFTVTTSYDDLLTDIGAGLDIWAINSGLSVKLGYDGKFGDDTESHAGTAKLRMTF